MYDHYIHYTKILLTFIPLFNTESELARYGRETDENRKIQCRNERILLEKIFLLHETRVLTQALRKPMNRLHINLYIENSKT